MLKNRRFWLLFVILLLPVSVLTASYLQDYFRSPELYRTGKEPLDLAVGDLNHDNYLDVVTANRGGRSLSVFIGNSDGTLTFIQEVDIGLAATSIAIADMNLDDNLDVVASVCNYGCTKNEIHIYHGQGDGKLVFAEKHNVSGVPYHIFVRDFDQDEFPDIAATDASEHRIVLLLSNQNSDAFSISYLPTGQRPISLAVGDINADGFLDLCTANQWDDTVTLFLGLGEGSFSTPQTIVTEDLPYAVSIADINGDTIEDLMVAHSSDPGQVITYLGNEQGELERYEVLPAIGRLIFVYAEDFNLDGKRDIAVTHKSTQNIHVYLNENDSFAQTELLSIPTVHEIFSLLIADLNDDDYPDLLTVEFNQAILSVALGKDPEGY